MYPIAFHINSLEIKSSSILLFIWIIISWIYLKNLIIKNWLSLNFLIDHYFRMILIFLITWRAGFIYLNWEMYKSNIINIVHLEDWNFSFFIWFIWFIFALKLFAFFKKETLSKWTDIIVRPFLLLMMFLSLSNFLSWTDYWIPTKLAVWVIFNVPEVRYTMPIHPIQIYEFIWALLILLFISSIARKKRSIWVISSLWFGLFFILELMITFLRANQDKLVLKGLFAEWIEFYYLFFWSLVIYFLVNLITRSHRNFI